MAAHLDKHTHLVVPVVELGIHVDSVECVSEVVPVDADISVDLVVCFAAVEVVLVLLLDVPVIEPDVELSPSGQYGIV